MFFKNINTTLTKLQHGNSIIFYKVIFPADSNFRIFVLLGLCDRQNAMIHEIFVIL